jgi:hypothetical protein
VESGVGWRRIDKITLLKLDPVWDPIRKDPRFQKWLESKSKGRVRKNTALQVTRPMQSPAANFC